MAGAPGVYAQSTADSKLTQTISAGTINTNFTDASGATVSNPSFAMSSATVSTTGNMTTTGTYGSDTQRATVDKPGLSSGFTLSLAAANPSIGWYRDGAPSVSVYKHNGSTESEGQLTVGSGGTLGQYTGSDTGITGSVGGTFSGTTPITIMAGASATMDSVWRGYVHGISLTQVIPKGTPAGSYSIDLVQTV
ncbi:hypothetical protein B7Y94_00335, partial [Candidatus Saccharibacteria bacterium 32-49-12]